MLNTTDQKPFTADDAIRRHPLLTAHLICESLGYYSPRAAAVAIADHQNDRGSYSELMLHLAGRDGDVKGAMRRLLGAAFSRRRQHQGYMADFGVARALVSRSIAGLGEPPFSSWQ